jgi:glycyl-tRNA synthetase alpha subunit
VTERVGIIARIRALAVAAAKSWVDQQKTGMAAAAAN